MFWIAISSICIAVTHGGMLFQFQPTGKDPLSIPWIKDYQCVPTVQASTNPVTAGNGETVFVGWDRKDLPQKYNANEVINLLQEAEERDRRSEPYRTTYPALKYEPEPTVTGWHCVDLEGFKFTEEGLFDTSYDRKCLREEGYRSDGVVMWRVPKQ